MTVLGTEYTTNKHLYAIFRNSSGLIWNGSSLVTMVVANWATYAVDLDEEPGSGNWYQVVVPILPDGVYDGSYIFERVTGTPLTTDPPIGSIDHLEIKNGSELTLSTIPARVWPVRFVKKS